ncbi:hypothetical protein HAX54_004223, partial [Datura stramonium]|nr:hypothetical protein [Datura stramonium]
NYWARSCLRLGRCSRAPTHEFPNKILLEKFYTGLDPLTQLEANNATYNRFMDKTCNRITTILQNNQAQPDLACMIQ